VSDNPFVSAPTVFHIDRVGFDRYDTVWVKEGHYHERELPIDDDVVAHAVQVLSGRFRPESKHPDFLDSWRYETARCGSVIKVVTPKDFDPADPAACPACVEAIAENRPTPQGRRWYEREYEKHVEELDD